MGERGKKSNGFFTFIKEKGRLWLLVGGALLGILLLLFGGMGEGAREETEIDTVSARVAELEAYEARLEGELKEICEATAGVGDCEILLTLERGYAIRYTENGEGDPVTVGTGSSEAALPDTLLPPVVSGVAIVCRGGERAATVEMLTELVSTALGIPANRVYVTGK